MEIISQAPLKFKSVKMTEAKAGIFPLWVSFFKLRNWQSRIPSHSHCVLAVPRVGKKQGPQKVQTKWTFWGEESLAKSGKSRRSGFEGLSQGSDGAKAIFTDNPSEGGSRGGNQLFPFRYFKLSPLQLFAAFLGMHALGAIIYNVQLEIFIHLGICVAGAIAFFFLFSRLTKKPKNIYNTLITALIIFLIWHPRNTLVAWLLTFSVIMCAMSFKFFLEYKNISWVNPAVFGLLTVSFFNKFFHIAPLSFASWWGTNYGGYFSFILMACWIALGFRTWRKWWIFGIFLIGSAACTWLSQGFKTAYFILTDATIYFLATVMLVDPKSSPVDQKEQIMCGIVAVIVYQLLFFLKIENFELLAIVAVNIVNLGFRLKTLSKIPEITSSQPTTLPQKLPKK